LTAGSDIQVTTPESNTILLAIGPSFGICVDALFCIRIKWLVELLFQGTNIYAGSLDGSQHKPGGRGASQGSRAQQQVQTCW
jgi:hypothetical protein